MTDFVPDWNGRFWSKVAPSSGCWLWRGNTLNTGYGAFYTGSRTDGSRKLRTAHRVAWELANGRPIPAGDHHGTGVIMHTCDVPACVNPAHLVLGTQRENAADMKRKGRARSVGNITSAKLTEADARDIRAALDRGELQSTLAARYGVKQPAISDVKRGKTWRAA